MNVQPYSNSYNFTAMKPSQFKGFDYAVVRKFKAPVEKFNENADFQNWARKRVERISNQDFGGRVKRISEERKSTIKEWVNYLLNTNESYTPAMALLVVSAIAKTLKPDTDTVPPRLNQGVLADSFTYLKNMLEVDKEHKFDFYKVYHNNLVATYMQTDDKKEGATGWVKIPSIKNDPENFEANVEKLKRLSCDSWCTKSYNAKPYLETGDFHIYIENGKPKLAIRMFADNLHEIQGERNNSEIPLKYLDELLSYIDKTGFSNLDEDAIVQIDTAVEKVAKKEVLLKAVEGKDYATLLTGLGFDILEKDEEGLHSVRVVPLVDFTAEELDFSIDDLFTKIKKIDYLVTELNMYNGLTTLGELEEVENSAHFNSKTLVDLGKLKRIGGLASFGRSIRSLGDLEYIGSDAWFCGSSILDLSGLKRVDGDVNLNELQLLYPKNYKFICKHFMQVNICFACCERLFYNLWKRFDFLNKNWHFEPKFMEEIE